jgi:serine/threonine protein kinase
LIGQTLNNRYTVTAQLGRGAMGTVYRAQDAQAGLEVALKVLAADLTFDPEMIERFRREGQALKQLRHPNIVSLVDTFQHEGRQVIVMEYVPGGSLFQLVRQGPLAVERARRMALELCDALTRAHHLNIIHRDLKPENILIAEDGTPKLTDFGVARLVGEGSRLTGTGTQVGTPFYMSPEAWQGQHLDAQADIWSLGIVLYEMLAGQVPFGGETMVAVMNRVLNAPLPDLKLLRPDVPPAMVKIIRKMLTRDKAKRYQTMRQVAVDLEQAAGSTSAAPSTLMATPAPTELKPAPPTVKVASAGAAPRAGGIPKWVWGVAVVGLLIIVSVAAIGLGGLSGVLRATHPQSTSAPPTDTASPPAQTPKPNTHTQSASAPPAGTSSGSRPPAASAPGEKWTSPGDGMLLLFVPAGEFVMGSTEADKMAGGDEKPAHMVYLDAFWIDRTEVTNAMYAQCVQARKCSDPPDKRSATRSRYYDNPQYANYPVIYVSWSDANTYCRWAGRRLPTEAEWEMAARGFSTRPAEARIYPWGNQSPDRILLNFNRNVQDSTAVGSYAGDASPYGALDMAGNVAEWVADWYSATYYAGSPARNPTGPGSGQYRVLRGGTWDSTAGSVRVAYRSRLLPEDRYMQDGFRCAASP